MELMDSHIKRYYNQIFLRNESANYYYSHIEHCRNRSLEYYYTHKEQQLKTAKEWRSKNKELCKDTNEKWKKDNPIAHYNHVCTNSDNNIVKIRKYTKEYRLSHPDMVKKSAKKWRDTNSERQKIVKASSIMLKSGLIPLTSCVLCGSNDKIMLFHLNYESPYDVKCYCKECFWNATKLRNREKKLNILKGLDNSKKV